MPDRARSGVSVGVEGNSLGEIPSTESGSATSQVDVLAVGGSLGDLEVDSGGTGRSSRAGSVGEEVGASGSSGGSLLLTVVSSSQESGVRPVSERKIQVSPTESI